MQISTMFETNEILELFEAQRIKLGLSQAELGRLAFGKPDTTAIQSLKKGSSPAVDRVAALAAVLGLEFYLGPKQIASVHGSAGLKEAESPDLGPQNALRFGFRAIPWHHSARPKGSVPVAFEASWLEKLDIEIGNLSLALPDMIGRASGAPSECVVLLESPYPQTGGPTLWCYKHDQKIIVRLTQWVDDRALLLGDEFDPEVQIVRHNDHRFIFLGRVVWQGTLIIDRKPS